MTATTLHPEPRVGPTTPLGEIHTRTMTARCHVCGHQWETVAQIIPPFRNPILPTICDTCAEERDRELAAKARAKEAQRQAEHRAKRESKWSQLCPREYRLTTEDGGETQLARLELECKALPQILAWKYSRRGLVIRSRRSGLCKTRAAFRLLRRLHTEGKSIAYFTAGAFQRKAQDAAGQYTLTQWFEHLAALDIVFLDDLGKGYWTENTEALWFDLVEHRTTHHQPVLVTTNYTGDEMIQGSRSEATAYTIRRLRDYCDAIVLP